MKLSRTSSPFLTLSPIFAACELERRIDMNPFDIPRKGASSNASGKGETTFAVCIEFACNMYVEGAHINSAFGAEHGSADKNLHSIPVSHAIPRPRSADEDCALRLITRKTW
jgi:hypothetical protein